eukprot:CAMPEP_0204404996 /NCGR_PEP_ID=MMETSP0470-20130426/7049_1 /ASSEMBLY_ACC=CAM_ASM_000385 /TAXON_ID=2969 /ORGANISM="Oxyrrhis marina" /LENGTH=87 /DNA_ID=CAMNT_0051400381 /DNA_START=23 /DNA_END=282 /DNA_ORIENTATION=+
MAADQTIIGGTVARTTSIDPSASCWSYSRVGLRAFVTKKYLPLQYWACKAREPSTKIDGHMGAKVMTTQKIVTVLAKPTSKWNSEVS